MLKNKYQGAIALLFFVIAPIAVAQQTCESRRSANERTSATYRLRNPPGQRPRDIDIACTSEDDKVRITLRDRQTRRTIQSFMEEQNQNYLEATTPDLDGDGYADLVLITNWGSPNMEFKAWRYDPARDRLKLALETIGTAFVRAKNGRLISVGKGGQICGATQHINGIVEALFQSIPLTRQQGEANAIMPMPPKVLWGRLSPIP